MKILDGFGKQCPMPLVMAKKELDAGATELAIQVDNETAVKNLTRLGKKKNMATSVDKIEGGWLITFGEGDGARGRGSCRYPRGWERMLDHGRLRVLRVHRQGLRGRWRS